MDASSIDAILGGLLVVEQPEKGVRAGIDAVLLAAFVPVTAGAPTIIGKNNEPHWEGRLADLGSGTGVVGLCAAALNPFLTVCGVEKQEHLAKLSLENARRNEMQDRVRAVCADVTTVLSRGQTSEAAPASFDHVAMNPPFYDAASSRSSSDVSTSQARSMAADDLDLWVKAAAGLAKADGSISIVHEASALPRILHALDGRFGGLQILPLHPRDNVAAKRVLVRGWKGRRGPLSLLSGLSLHGADGDYSPGVEDILRGSARFDMDGGIGLPAKSA